MQGAARGTVQGQLQEWSISRGALWGQESQMDGWPLGTRAEPGASRTSEGMAWELAF